MSRIGLGSDADVVGPGGRKPRVGLLLVGLCSFAAMTALLFVGSEGALADVGVSTAKGCSPVTVPIGTMVMCHYSFSNNGASAAEGNTVWLSSIVDTVASSPPDVSGNLLNLNGTGLTLTGGATCDGTKCILPPNASITTPNIPFHTATAGDYALNGDHTLGDTAAFGWNDTCNVTTVAEEVQLRPRGRHRFGDGNDPAASEQHGDGGPAEWFDGDVCARRFVGDRSGDGDRLRAYADRDGDVHVLLQRELHDWWHRGYARGA